MRKNLSVDLIAGILSRLKSSYLYDTIKKEVIIMNINTDNLIPMTEANQNFSKVVRMVDQKGSVLILKNNVPRYLVLDFQKIQEESTMADEDVMAVSRRLMKENKEAYEVLAK